MLKNNIKPLMIGDLKVYPPIIQGGMGVRVSRAGLASAVANAGCVGVIASVGLGNFENRPGSEYVQINEDSLRKEIREARKKSKGIIGVNIMVALANYKSLVKVSVEEGIDIIISGAGLPLDLPEYTQGKNIKLIPIVSSVKAFNIIYKKWKSKYNKIPDAVIVEGGKAGGHIGFKFQELQENTYPELGALITEMVDAVKATGSNIPVIAAGGVYDGKDIARYLSLGASGVQMGTRFVCTTECDVHESFKQAYLNAKESDTIIIKSPAGMPGRALMNKFVEKIKNGTTVPMVCTYHCLKTCVPSTAPYCIAKALANAAEGNLDEAIIFAGANVYRCNEIIPVQKLIDKLMEEMKEA